MANTEQSAIISDPAADKAWVESLSYQELMEHFRCASFANKFHNGLMGKHFSDAMNAKRAALDPDQVKAIDLSAAAIPRQIPATKH